MNNKPNTKEIELDTQTLETLETVSLEEVSGGIRWPGWAYKVGNWAAQQDPSQIAAGFLM